MPKGKTLQKRTPLENTQLLLDISVTERDTFKTCRRRWELEVLENLQPFVPLGQALDFGEGIHEALESYYIAKANAPSLPPSKKKSSPLKSALSALDNWYERNADRVETDPDMVMEAKDAFLDQLFEQSNLAEEMLRGYHQYAQQEDNFTVHAVEGLQTGAGKSWLHKHWEDREFMGEHSENGVILDEVSGRLLCPILDPKTQQPLPGKPMLTAKIDLLVNVIEEGLKGLWVYDHKSTMSEPNDRGLDFFDQPTGYCYIVWRWLGIPPRGVCYNYLVKRVPHEPFILKNKKLSTRRDQLTTAEMYHDELEKHGLILKDGSIRHDRPTPQSVTYEEAYEALLSRGFDPFFKRHYTQRSVTELRNFEERLHAEYQDMLDVYEGVAEAYPSFGFPHMPWCNWCSVAPICQAMNDGSDVDGIIEQRFMEKPDRKAVRHW
jgi:hypothetical protein